MPDTPFIDVKTAGLVAVIACALAATPAISGVPATATDIGPEASVKCHVEVTMAKHVPKAPAGATCGTCHLPGGSHAFKKSKDEPK